MEEAVTKKFVHEESGAVTSLCGAVEACLIQGLRRRALGLFKTSSTTALLHKIAKVCPFLIALKLFHMSTFSSLLEKKKKNWKFNFFTLPIFPIPISFFPSIWKMFFGRILFEFEMTLTFISFNKVKCLCVCKKSSEKMIDWKFSS